MPFEPLPDLAGMSLADVAAALESRRLPPIERWNPSASIDSGMRIAADGTWFHEGRPITRPAMVRAFSSLLARDDEGRHWLMTPECRQSIEVEDAAFIAVEVRADGGALVFRLNTDDLVIAGPGNPLRAAGDAETPAIYLAVRNGCEARINRATWIDLAQRALAAGDDLILSSKGATFSLRPA